MAKSLFTQKQEYINIARKAIEGVFISLHYNEDNEGLDSMMRFSESLTSASAKEMLDSLVYILEILEYKEFDLCDYNKHPCFGLKTLDFRMALKSLTTETCSKNIEYKDKFKKVTKACVSKFTKDCIGDNGKEIVWLSEAELNLVDTIDMLVALMIIFSEIDKPVIASIFARYMYKDFDRYMSKSSLRI